VWPFTWALYVGSLRGPFTWSLCPSYKLYLVLRVTLSWALCPSYILYLVLRVTLYVGPLRVPFVPQMDHLLLLLQYTVKNKAITPSKNAAPRHAARGGPPP